MSDDFMKAFTVPKVSTIEFLPPPTVSFHSATGPCLIIKADGTIEIGAGFTPTEAGKEAIEAMRYLLASLFDAEREACANLVEEMSGADVVYPAGIEMIASAIRSRKGTP